MSRSSLQMVGDFQLAIQQYEYKQHKLICVIKILPRILHFYKRKPQKVYQWLDYTHWAQIEDTLLHIFESINDWKNTAKLNTELFIKSNIKIHIKALNDFPSSILELTQETPVPNKDVALEIAITHLPSEVKRNKKSQVVESQNSNEASDVKTKKKKNMFKNDNTETFVAKDAYHSNKSVSSMNKRRSVSQDSTFGNVKNHKPRKENHQKLSHSPETKASTASDRPGRSLVKPMRYKEFILK